MIITAPLLVLMLILLNIAFVIAQLASRKKGSALIIFARADPDSLANKFTKTSNNSDCCCVKENVEEGGNWIMGDLPSSINILRRKV